MTAWNWLRVNHWPVVYAITDGPFMNFVPNRTFVDGGAMRSVAGWVASYVVLPREKGHR